MDIIKTTHSKTLERHQNLLAPAKHVLRDSFWEKYKGSLKKYQYEGHKLFAIDNRGKSDCLFRALSQNLKIG